MYQIIKTLKALSDPNRLRILKMLEQKPLCVCEITEILGLAISTVSKHLSLLRDAGFIRDHKDGKWVNYILEPDSYASNLYPLISTWLKENAQISADLLQLRNVDRTQICAISKSDSSQ